MYTTISGIYENGRVILQKSAPTKKSMKVLVVFVEENTEALPEQSWVQQSAEASRNHSFSERWQGQFKLADKTDDARLDYLQRRYQL
ncbi:MAG: hypothetical protein CTY16_06835 [Methylobacter sp.]|nr:MAG: hypothetical protein CTY16_06835 [Methylobacter sp.]